MLHDKRILLLLMVALTAILCAHAYGAAIRPGGLQPGLVSPAAGNVIASTRTSILRNASLGGLESICQVGGQMYGAGGGKIVALDQNGAITRSIPIGVSGVAGLSSHGPGAIIFGDPQANTIQKLDLGTGQVSRLLALGDARWAPSGGISKVPTGTRIIPLVVGAGRLASVASDGKFAYVAYSAGFSSSIFKIDSTNGNVVAHGWSPGDNPGAMTFHNGGLFVMDSKGQEIRRLDTNLEQSGKIIPTGVRDGKGLIISDTEVDVLSPAEGGVVKMGSNIALAQVATPRQALRPVSGLVAGKFPLLMANNYAVLICGDTAESCYYCDAFWNDTLWLYKTLLAKGYTKEKIFVLYGNGYDFASANPKYQYPETVTDFAATMGNVTMMFDGLRNGDAAHGIPKMTENDTLFLWTFDHGSGNQPAYLCLRDGWYKDSDFAAKLNAIPYAKRAIFMQQCRSGGFIDDLRNSKTFISTASRADENAHAADTENELYGGKTYWHGEYNFHITSALSGLNCTGGAVNADANGNGLISALEMHNWNVGHESQSETPQVDDMGGVGANFNP